MTDSPQPHVPLLEDENLAIGTIEGTALKTWVNPGMQSGDPVYINWRGCGPNGEVQDVVGVESPIEVDPALGGLVEIPVRAIEAVAGGYVFYSYAPGDRMEPDAESARLFFSVDNPRRRGGGLGVAQIAESHDLELLNVDQLDDDLTVMIPPYQAMAARDELVMTWQAYMFDTPEMPYTSRHEVTLEEVGKPLRIRLPREQVWDLYDGDYADLHYEVTVQGTPSTRSPVQRFAIVLNSSGLPLLDAPRIPGHDGSGYLNPVDYPQGIPLVVTVDDEVQPEDEIILHASGPDLSLRSLRTDISNVDGLRAEVLLEPQWLSDGRYGHSFVFHYHIARRGMARRSAPLELMLRKPLYLPWPLIDDARQESGEEPYRGTVHPRDVRFGAKVRIPADAETAGAQVTVHWEGVSSTGSAIVKDHVPGDPSSYHIPLEAVPANMGHAERVKVYYSATPTNEATQYSPPFELYVEDYPQSSWPQLHCEGISNGQIVLKDVPPEGSPCALDAWSFMAAGQRVRIRARGLNQPGKPDSTWLRDDVPVSEDEYYAEKVKAVLPRTFLEGLQVNHEVLLSVEVSFDDGLSYKTFRTVSARLVP